MVEWFSDKRLYLDAEGKATEDDSVAVSLLVGKGGSINKELANSLGLGVKVKEEIKEQVTQHKAVDPPKSKNQILEAESRRLKRK